MQYWLLKTEPETFGMTHLQKSPHQTTGWEGVRNYQARNLLRDNIRKGDLAFFYHSNCSVPGIAGIVEVTSASYPDETAFDPNSPYYDPKSTPQNPRWFQVNVKLVEPFNALIPLHTLRQNPLLQDMVLLRKGNRLSVSPVTKKEWEAILALHHNIPQIKF